MAGRCPSPPWVGLPHTITHTATPHFTHTPLCKEGSDRYAMEPVDYLDSVAKRTLMFGVLVDTA